MQKVQLIFNDKYFTVRNFSRPKFVHIGCLQTFGEKVAWTDAVMAGKFESHFTGHHCMFAKSIPERDRLKTALSSKSSHLWLLLNIEAKKRGQNFVNTILT